MILIPEIVLPGCQQPGSVMIGITNDVAHASKAPIRLMSDCRAITAFAADPRLVTMIVITGDPEQ